MTATALSSLPTAEELAEVESQISQARDALDCLSLPCFRFDDEAQGLVTDAIVRPSLAELGRLSVFISRVETDLQDMSTYLATVRRAHYAGTLAVWSDDAS